MSPRSSNKIYTDDDLEEDLCFLSIIDEHSPRRSASSRNKWSPRSRVDRRSEVSSGSAHKHNAREPPGSAPAPPGSAPAPPQLKVAPPSTEPRGGAHAAPANGTQSPRSPRGPRNSSGSSKVVRPTGDRGQATPRLHEEGGAAPRGATWCLDAPGRDKGRPLPKACDHAIHVSILKELLGQEMRELIRNELSVVREDVKAALSRPPAVSGSFCQNADEDAARAPDAVRDIDVSDIDACRDGPAKADGGSACRDANDNIINVLSKAMTTLPTMQDLEDEAEIITGLPKKANKLVLRIDSYVAKLGTMTAPNQPECLRRFLHSYYWLFTVHSFTLLNCVFMATSANYFIENYDEDVNDASFLFFVFDIAFLCFFTLEFWLNVANYRLYYFFDKNWMSNWIDSILLAINFASVMQTLLQNAGQMSQNYSLRVVLRLLRSLKAFRVLRLATYFKPLRAILASLVESAWSLFWSITMLAMVYFMFALVLVSRVAAHLGEMGSDVPPEVVDQLKVSFGSVGIAMENLAMMTTGGKDWGDDYELVASIGVFSQSMFLLFFLFVQLALLNIITGVFIDEALKSLQPDERQKARQLALDEQHLKDHLIELCDDIDLNHSGRLNPEEWQSLKAYEKKREIFDMLGLPEHQVCKLFYMLCAKGVETRGEGSVQIIEFARECIRMRNQASPFHFHQLLFEMSTIKNALMEEIRQVNRLVDAAVGTSISAERHM